MVGFPASITGNITAIGSASRVSASGGLGRPPRVCLQGRGAVGILQDTGNKHVVRILLECILVINDSVISFIKMLYYLN